MTIRKERPKLKLGNRDEEKDDDHDKTVDNQAMTGHRYRDISFRVHARPTKRKDSFPVGNYHRLRSFQHEGHSLPKTQLERNDSIPNAFRREMRYTLLGSMLKNRPFPVIEHCDEGYRKINTEEKYCYVIWSMEVFG